MPSDASTSTSRALLALATAPRVQLAVKAAVAAALAWWIAPHVPGVAAHYPYYAPLGAVVSMYPTLASSLRQGAQTLAGLLTGIALAAVVIGLGHASALTVGLVVAGGVLLAGLPFLGVGRDWVPMAGLFVLLIGGGDSESYSFAYVVQMLVGIAIGLVVNLVVVPPLHTGAAARRLAALRGELAERADDLADALAASWPVEDDEWRQRVEALPVTQARVRAAVDLADDSWRLNPRRLAQRLPRPASRRQAVDLAAELVADRDRLQASERTAFHLRDAAEVIGHLVQRDGRGIHARDDVAEPLERLMRQVAETLRAPAEKIPSAAADGRRAVDAVWAHVDGVGSGDGSRSPGSARETGGAVSVAISMTRILEAFDPTPIEQTGVPAETARERV